MVSFHLPSTDFSIFPHLDYPGWPDNTLAKARSWAAEIAGPAYAIDDQTAITVVDGIVDIVSEGHWEQFRPLSAPPCYPVRPAAG